MKAKTLSFIFALLSSVISFGQNVHSYDRTTNLNHITMKSINYLQTLLVCAAAFLATACGQQENAPAATATGEPAWPEIQQQTKPWARWWWPASAVGESDIDSMLDSYSEAGLGGMEVTTIYGAKGYEDQYRDYLTPEWMDLFEYTLKGAEARDMGIDLANASGWPFGGPWVTPDYSCRYLATKVWKVKGGEGVSEKVEYIERPLVRTVGTRDRIEDMEYPIAANDSLQQHAYEQVRYPVSLPLMAVTANSADGQYVELTSKVDADGKLNWTAPDGDWTICALFLGWHGKLVERAGPGGEGDVIDHFSGAATSRYLAKFDEAFKGRDVSHIRYYFNDSYEVDDAQGNSDWTEDFFNEFRKRRGYDLKPHMAELLGLIGEKESNDRLVFDYRTTISELLLENYSVLWQSWAAKQGKGTRNQAHGSPANILDLYAACDVPETEGRSIIGMKTASSASHVMDKPLTSAEAATWLNDHFRSTLGDVKTSVDTYLLAGVNHIFYHGVCLSPDNAPWPGWMFYAAVHFQPTNSFWADFGAFNKYVARCQSFLQAGRPDNDILLFFDATDLYSERGREQLLYHMSQTTAEQSAIGASAKYLYGKGYTWDYITDKMLDEAVSVRNGDIVTAAGNSYRTIIIPECKKMIPETFDKIVALARKGATVLVENALPEDVPGFNKLEQRRAAFNKAKAALKFNDENGMKVAHVGKGRICVSSDIDAMIAYAGITREKLYDLGLQSISRVKPDGGKYYFIKNPTSETIEGWIPVDAVCGSIAVYDPMTDEFGFGRIRKADDGRKDVFMKILPDQSFLLETFEGDNAPTFDFFDKSDMLLPVGNEWTVTFTKGGPELPASQTVSSLASWTTYGKDYEIFSGSAEYKTTLAPFSWNGGAGQNVPEYWMLDLGTVRNSAAVYLDGEYLGTVFKKPYAVKISAEKLAKGGELTVRVSNSMENRISWMDRNHMPWRILYNANIAARTAQSRGADGLFSAENWDIVDSGLLGPVTLAALEPITPTASEAKIGSAE